MDKPPAPTIDQRLAAREPEGRTPVMFQTWRELLFLHWRFPAEDLQGRLPPGLYVDCHEGDAYVGVVPFFMCGVRPRFLPRFPGLSDFLELNVRTYVHDDAGVPGVWFFSLDANCAPAVWLARALFKLPYRRASMSARRPGVDGWVDYASRCDEGGYDARFRYRPAPGKTPRRAEPGTLEFFLLERYFLYAYDTERAFLLRGQVAHEPYGICAAEVGEWSAAPMVEQGIAPPERGFCHSCIAADVDVRILGIRRC